jgi:anti-anti-sigma regulatory factor
VLRITINETPTEKRWILQGRLVGPWVGELRTSWKRPHRNHGGRTCIVDLSDVTFIDNRGERLLQTMSKEGAQFIATGIYIKHVLQQRCAK